MNPDDTNQDLPKISNSGAADDNNTNELDQQAIQSATPSTSSPQPDLVAPAEAADTDLIEKEWVERAKQIVEHTKNDPHEQQRALSRIKADYMKKRYNKDIKVSEE